MWPGTVNSDSHPSLGMDALVRLLTRDATPHIILLNVETAHDPNPRYFINTIYIVKDQFVNSDFNNFMVYMLLGFLPTIIV